MTASTVGLLAWGLMVVGWYVIRYPFERRAKRKVVSTTRRGTAETVRMAISLAGLGIVPGVLAATGFPRSASYEPGVVQILAGIAFAGLALVLFRRTHKALGRMWSVSLDIRDEHKLVTDGIYRHVRHPMYTAFWTMALAQALLVPNLVAGLAGLVGFGILFSSRIGPEERMMEDAFGEEYRRYRERTARILPGIF